MWKEWLDPFNSFNGIKALSHSKHLKTVTEWLAKKDGVVLPPPITVFVDATNICNVNCSWCHTKEFRAKNPRSISDAVFIALPEFLQSWGVKSLVLTGGEPLLHTKVIDFLEDCGARGIKVGLETNALSINENNGKAILKNVSWVAVSLDCSVAGTYLRLKKAQVNTFDRVLDNVRWLTSNRENGIPEVVVKFLIHHNTYSEMYAAADLARAIGANAIYYRPFFQPKYHFSKGVRRTASYYLREARRDFEKEDFKIYGIVHKFDKEWEKIVRFETCAATATTVVLGADEKAYICPDRRGDGQVSLGKYHPFENLKKAWGSEQHRSLMTRIMPALCPRCSLSDVNEVVDRCILKDDMYSDFL